MGDSKSTQVGLGFLLLAVLAALPLTSLSDAGTEWWSLTSRRYVRRMLPVGDTLFLATSGGIVEITDPRVEGRTLVNSDGLGTTDITDMIVDADGTRWATAFGRLIRFDRSGSRQYLFFDREEQSMALHCLVDDGDWLWVGTEIGLALFSKTIDGGQRQDTYTNFGDLSGDPRVIDIWTEGDSLWVATTVGLAVTSKADPRLMKVPSKWTVFDSDRYPELQSDTITQVVRFESIIYVGTSVGLYRLVAEPSVADTGFEPLPLWPTIRFTDLYIDNDSLFVFATHPLGFYGGMGVVKEGVSSELPLAGFPSVAITARLWRQQRWVAVARGGVYYNVDGEYREYPYTGLPDNNVSDLAVNAGGNVTAGFRDKRAPARSDDGWELIDIENSWTTYVIVDSAARAWVGTYGGGVWVIDDDTVINYDETNSTLIGNTDDPPNGLRYVVIYGLDTDGRYLYAAAYRAANNNPISIGDLTRLDDPGGWTSLGLPDGITDNRPVALDHHQQYLAMATESNGVYLYYLGPDPFDKADDSVVHLTEASAFLLSDGTTSVKFAPDGTLWVGTGFGLSRYDYGIDRFVDVTLPEGVGPVVTDIEFDGRGNMWVGTTTGLARFDKGFERWEVYITRNSDLIADAVNAVTYDHFTGDVYVATDRGVSYRRSEYGRPTSDVASVIAFPNPFLVRYGDEELRFNFAGSGIVRIFTVAGAVIDEFPIRAWDGRNKKGQEVASGVYLFVISADDGRVGRGKFLLIRQ